MPARHASAMRTRVLRLLALVPLASFVVGCGGDENGGTGGPVGEHHGYVIGSLTLPLDATSAMTYGFDLDDDGTVDNQLAAVFSALIQAAGSGSLDLQGAVAEAVDDGSTLMLLDLQATSLSEASDVGLSIYEGIDPVPAPCTNPLDPLTCRQHLMGTGSFGVAAPAPTDSPVLGAIAGGTFDGGAGTVTLSFRLIGPQVSLTLDEARAHLVGITTDSIASGVISGLIPEAEIDVLTAALQKATADAVTRDCTGVGAGCGCLSGSTGEVLLALFDTTADCSVPLEEIQTNSVVQTLLQPDVDSDADGVADSMSIGVGFTAVKATFTPPATP